MKNILRIAQTIIYFIVMARIIVVIATAYFSPNSIPFLKEMANFDILILTVILLAFNFADYLSTVIAVRISNNREKECIEIEVNPLFCWMIKTNSWLFPFFKLGITSIGLTFFIFHGLPERFTTINSIDIKKGIVIVWITIFFLFVLGNCIVIAIMTMQERKAIFKKQRVRIRTSPIKIEKEEIRLTVKELNGHTISIFGNGISKKIGVYTNKKTIPLDGIDILTVHKIPPSFVSKTPECEEMNLSTIIQKGEGKTIHQITLFDKNKVPITSLPATPRKLHIPFF